MVRYNKLSDLQKALEKKFTNAMRAGALTTFQNIIVGSPVDTGRFRMNWQATIQSPNYNIVGADLVTKKDEHGKPIKNQFTQTVDVNSGISGYTLNDAMYLTNNLPYAQRLANGWSGQRSSGWVDIEVQNGVKAVADALKKGF